MTAGTVFNHPSAGPVRDALAVGTANPVFFLPEVALTAQLVAVIHIHFHAIFGFQKITLFFAVAAETGQGPRLAAVRKDNFTMGDLGSVCNPDRFVIMTFTAFKALNLIFAGLGPENPPLIYFGNLNGTYRKRQDRIDLLFIIKGPRCILIGLYDSAFYRIGRAYRKNQQQSG